ncbi:MAG: leucine-rich repeat domain-containing protein [Dehalococcoidia bacterium]|nr:leucine-rich repeat domain-containing protein [Dehalococcoidia bacterium]
MKTILNSRRYHYMARVGIFLIAVSLIAGMVGCAATPQHDLAILSTDALTETGTGSIIPAIIEFAPDVLNLRSKGQFLTAYIELPPGYDAGQIDVSSIRLNGTVPALTKPTAISDYDSDGIPDLMVKFDRAAVEALLMPASQVEMTIMGEVAGIAFEGSDTVRVINPAWCSLNVSSTTGGSVSVPGEGTFSYKAKTVVGPVATPSTGYRFLNWTGDVGTVGDVNAASTNITMNGDYSITANFIAQYDLTISSTAGGSVPAPGEGIFTYDAETVVNLVATPASGYGFANWTGDVDTVGDVNAASTNITMNGDYSITANFAQEPVAFPDANLEAAIREAIAKPTGPIYPSNLRWLNILPAAYRRIANLAGLEYCTSLMMLNLADNQISDISPLTNLRGLIDLNLKGNQISDISPLANLDLASLRLDANQISDISPLANLTGLIILYLNYNWISDISPLANLTSLTRLLLRNNQISDISPLANLTNLRDIDLGDNGISDISPLVNNPGLAEWDDVVLLGNPLSPDSINIYIPQLEARGVTVYY